MAGLLRVRGKLEVQQFWPIGTSDADTVNLIVDVNKQSFAFAADGKNFKITKVFFGAISKGRGSKPVVSKNNKITIRLQGIDAPELHYKAAPLAAKLKPSKAKRKAFNEANKERCQHWGESAAAALGKKIATVGSGTIDCEFVSFVDAPKDVTDVYGRFIGNVRVGKKFDVDINTWLVEQGFAYPTFYNSMSKEEIEELLAAMKKGVLKKRVFKDYSKDTNVFFPKLLYRRPKKGVTIKLQDDSGDLLMPKIYRRQVTFRMQKQVGLIGGTFAEFLQSNPEECHTLDDFLKLGNTAAPTHKLHEFMQGKTFTLKPNEIVFREQGATLVDSRGRELTKF
jgi:endonuclease YncB( thermonuclease family)